MAQALKLQALCMSANEWNVPATDSAGNATGEILEGITIWYYFADDLSPCDDGGNKRGIDDAKFTLPIEKKHQAVFFPGWYEFTCEMVAVSDKNRDGSKRDSAHNELRPRDIKFLGTVGTTIEPIKPAPNAKN
ncbi:hypothetical protein FACS189490_10340 [Clostridia bacterium]|nr:hypothetical protein FACS189490_10340 [Clostridia bacterium]